MVTIVHARDAGLATRFQGNAPMVGGPDAVLAVGGTRRKSRDRSGSMLTGEAFNLCKAFNRGQTRALPEPSPLPDSPGVICCTSSRRR